MTNVDEPKEEAIRNHQEGLEYQEAIAMIYIILKHRNSWLLEEFNKWNEDWIS